MIPDPWPDQDPNDPRASVLGWVLFYVGVALFAGTWLAVH